MDLNIVRQKRAGNLTAAVRLNKGANQMEEQKAPKYGSDSVEMVRTKALPKLALINVNALVPGALSNDKVADCVHSKQDTGYTADEIVAAGKLSEDHGGFVFK
eukprot:m.257644 g.257644  ORF g.257644 m.257644 type:complete len:103 (+) comp35507_c0_seq1:156-464(+)